MLQVEKKCSRKRRNAAGDHKRMNKNVEGCSFRRECGGR